MKFYVLDENNNKAEALDKEGILAVLQQAIADGTLENIVADSAFISKIKCCVSGITNNVAFVTQNKYNELESTGQIRENTYYYITDDTTCEDIDKVLQGLTASVNELLKRATIVEVDGVLKYGNMIIPQRKLISSNINVPATTGYDLTSILTLGKTYEFNVTSNDGSQEFDYICKIKLTTNNHRILMGNYMKLEADCHLFSVVASASYIKCYFYTIGTTMTNLKEITGTINSIHEIIE